MKIEIDVDNDGTTDIALDVPEGMAMLRKLVVVATATVTGLCALFGGIVIV